MVWTRRSLAARRRIQMGAYVCAQKFFAGFVAEHADHSVVDVEELTFGSGEEQTFLNVVEELAITALGFTAIADVFQNVNGATVFFRGAAGSRSRNDKGAAFAGGDIFLAEFDSVLAEGAGKRAAGFGDVAQSSHRFANESDGRNAQVRGEGTIRANDVPSLIVNDDVITDGVNIFDPLFLGTLQLRKTANFLHDQSGITGESGEQALFFGGHGASGAAQAESAHEFLVAGIYRIENTEGRLTFPRQDFEAGAA